MSGETEGSVMRVVDSRPSRLQGSVRALRATDLDDVVALDARITGRRRCNYFLRRLEAALSAPEKHIQLAAVDSGHAFAGFVLYRLESGEFGREASLAALETIGIVPERRRQGMGAALVSAAHAILRGKGIDLEATRADWRNHALLSFLDGVGFTLAPRHVIGLDIAGARPSLVEDAEAVSALSAPGIQVEPHEFDFGKPEVPVWGAPARDRVPVRSMREDDLAAVVRIDSRSVGHARHAYIRDRFTKAMTNNGVRLSLVAEVDKIPIGFMMANVEYGEFGRTEPVAVLDTMGVDPDFRRIGVGSALFSQLTLNLSALGVEHVETELARDQFDLLGFFYRRGFSPSQRLAFAHALA